jgi:hypothetical protein
VEEKAPVNPAPVQALLALDTVMPARLGTARHGVGAGVGRGVGRGVGAGVCRGVGGGVDRGLAMAVAAGVAGVSVWLPTAGVGFDRPLAPG